MSSIKYTMIICITLLSGSCAISKKENDRFDKIDAGQIMSNTLTNDSVSQESLRHFEDRAIQKLVDFYDYLNILGHDNFNEDIMDEVRFSAEKLFFYAEEVIDPFMIRHQELPVKSIRLLLTENSGENPLPEMEILNVEIIDKLQRNEHGFYVGELSFDIKSNTDAVIVSKQGVFSLRKIDKKFGSETIKVWEVFLDRIL